MVEAKTLRLGNVFYAVQSKEGLVRENAAGADVYDNGFGNVIYRNSVMFLAELKLHPFLAAVGFRRFKLSNALPERGKLVQNLGGDMLLLLHFLTALQDLSSGEER
jgi:hypothetical protein